MIYLSKEAILDLHERALKHSGGAPGVRDAMMIELALEQPRKTLAGQQIYASLLEKATAMSYSILQNRPFVDGNKRVSHYALSTFLRMNGHDIVATPVEQENVMLALARGNMDPKHFVAWLRQNTLAKAAK
jgi:death-on-curing protein